MRAHPTRGSLRAPRHAPLRAIVALMIGGSLLAACAPAPHAEDDRAPDAVAEREDRHSERRWRRWGSWSERRESSRWERPAAPNGEGAVPTTVPSSRPAPTTPPPTLPPTPAPAPTPAPTAPAGARVPNGPTGQWTLKFADEFDGNSLDLSKWRPNWLASSDTARTQPVNDLEHACYDPAQVRVAGGTLRMTAERVSPRAGCVLRNGSTASYATGLIQSNEHYRFTYGYVEARMLLPGSGNRPENWPAFWTNGQNWPRDGEIDVMEVLGGEPRWHYHWSGGDVGSDFDLVAPKAGWHTFGALWEPGRITFYYDGRNVGSVTTGVTSSPHYMILSNALSSTISGPITVPSTVQVDYVRHWQR